MYNINEDEVAERIFGVMKEKSISNKELAEKLGFKSANNVSNWKIGLNKSYMKMLYEIANILCVPRDYLAYGDESRYYTNPCVSEQAEEMVSTPGARALMDAGNDLTEEEIIQVKSFIAGLKANRR